MLEMLNEELDGQRGEWCQFVKYNLRKQKRELKLLSSNSTVNALFDLQADVIILEVCYIMRGIFKLKWKRLKSHSLP